MVAQSFPNHARVPTWRQQVQLRKLVKANPSAVESYMPQVIQAIRNDGDMQKSGDLRILFEDTVFKEVKSK